jgi:hypothetical protein
MSMTVQESMQQNDSDQDSVPETEVPVRPNASAGRGRPGLLSRLRAVHRRARDEGMAAAEYAIVTMVGCTFAGLLLGVLSSAQVRTALSNLIKRALSVA